MTQTQVEISFASRPDLLKKFKPKVDPVFTGFKYIILLTQEPREALEVIKTDPDFLELKKGSCNLFSINGGRVWIPSKN